MWTLAASLSTQFQHIRDSLYTGTKQMLEAMERRGWMSAGRVFRLVQLMRLYEIDGPGVTAPPPICILSEEKRQNLLDGLVIGSAREHSKWLAIDAE